MKYARLTPGAGFLPVHSLLYYGQRVLVAPALRGPVVRLLAAAVRLRRGLGAYRCDAPACERRVQRLRQDGYVALGQLLDARQIADIRAYLRPRPMIERAGQARSFTESAVPAGARMAEYSMDDVLACPHVLALANSAPLLACAQRYIGCKPTISSLWVRWSFPSTSDSAGLQGYHRDSEDWRYLKVLVYLSEVGLDDGPHAYVLGTHRDRAPLRLRQYDDAQIGHLYGTRVVNATGAAGSGFAVDTAGIHKGTVPAARARLLLQIQYSLLPAYAYRYAPQAHPHARAFDPYINRLLIR
ncbi:MAG: hypothetical protein V4582_15565 [Pseudomonadota bacterium]